MKQQQKKNNKKKESNIDECIKRDYDLIVKETNMVSQKVYKVFKDTYKESTKKEIDIFYKNNPSAPKVKDIDNYSDDCYIIILNYNGENYDAMLYFDEAVYRELKKSDKLKKLGYHLSHEDYPGIFIER